MKKNFTESEKTALTNSLATVMNHYFEVKWSKGGNLMVVIPGMYCWWTLYNTPVNNGKLVWRRLWKDFWGGYRSHLLNCRGRNKMKNGFYTEWDNVTAHAGINTFDEAVSYFTEYIKKYN